MKPEINDDITKALTRNALHCNVCDTTIESVHRHDFRACKCPDSDDGSGTRVFIDGGLVYVRVLWSKDSDFEMLTEYAE